MEGPDAGSFSGGTLDGMVESDISNQCYIFGGVRSRRRYDCCKGDSKVVEVTRTDGHGRSGISRGSSP